MLPYAGLIIYSVAIVLKELIHLKSCCLFPQLSEKVSEAGREIETLQMQLGVKDAMSEAEIAAKGAG